MHKLQVIYQDRSSDRRIKGEPRGGKAFGLTALKIMTWRKGKRKCAKAIGKKEI